MSSVIYVTISLDEFYQRFLRSHFNCTDEVFNFPNGDDLATRLCYHLKKPPYGYVPEQKKNEFKIKIPRTEEKDPYSYNYLSPKGEELLVESIKAFCKTIFHETLNKRRRKNKDEKKQLIWGFIDQYDLDPDDYERLAKDYQRYVCNKISEKYRKKNKNKILKK